MLSLRILKAIFLVLTISMVSANDRSARKSFTRAPCYENIHGYEIPPERVGVKDRLCLGCSNYPSALHRGESLTSASGNFTLSMESNNNLVLYSKERNNAIVWKTDTANEENSDPGNFSLVLEEDGLMKLSVHDDREDSIWCNTKPARLNSKDQPIYLVLANNGNLILYQCSVPYWYSATWGKTPPRVEILDEYPRAREWFDKK